MENARTWKQWPKAWKLLTLGTPSDEVAKLLGMTPEALKAWRKEVLFEAGLELTQQRWIEQSALLAGKQAAAESLPPDRSEEKPAEWGERGGGG